MVKEEKNIPDWKKRVPYEKSEAAYHEKHLKAGGHEKASVPEVVKGVKEAVASRSETTGYEKAKGPDILRGVKEAVTAGGAAVSHETSKVPDVVKDIKEAVTGREAPVTREKLGAYGFSPGMRESATRHEDVNVRRTEAGEAGKTSMRVCDACERAHSTRCEIIDYAGVKFNVCGECIPPVRENPADFLAGKKGTDSEGKDFDVCGTEKR